MSTIRIISRYFIIIVGFSLCGLGNFFTILADLGTSPWTAFHAGLSNYLPLTIGQASQVIGVLIIILSYTLGIKARLGTFLNMFCIGFFLDTWAWLGLFPDPSSFLMQVFYLLAGVVIFGAGIGAYVSVGLGAGPRDGLTLGLHQRLGLSIRVVRSSMELTVLTLGFILGGPIGIGTVIFAVTIGPAMQFFLKLCTRYISPLFIPDYRGISPAGSSNG